MSPNLFLLGKLIVSPQQWFVPRSGSRSPRKQEHWDAPIPGTYEYIPGRGWYLIAIDAGHQTSPQLRLPQPATYCKILHRPMLRQEFESRRKFETVKGQKGGFFLMDDGVTWVRAWDKNGAFIAKDLEKWIIDSETRLFRRMTRDDVEWVSRRGSLADSPQVSSQASPRSHSVVSPRIASRKSYESSQSTSLQAYRTYDSSTADSIVPGTALTTPSINEKEAECLSATELRSRLMELGSA
jgi:hypothetical protein